MIKRAKGDKAKCDKLFSELIRAVGRCERCGSTDWLQTSHIVSRRYSATRCDLRNAQCLCARCHRHFTDWPLEFSKWLDQSIGREVYEELKLQAEAVTKVDWSVVLQDLLEHKKSMEN